MFRTIEADLLRELTPWPQLISGLARAFQTPCQAPRRQHYEIPVPGSMPGTLLTMPAWTVGGLLGVKLVQAFPGNSERSLPSINGLYMLASATDGTVCALMDAQELTCRRTAAASALASTFLSRPDSRNLLVMGTGRLAFDMAAAHSSIRPIKRVAIWGRSATKASALAARVRKELKIEAIAAGSLDEEIAQADIISTVTTSQNPILRGRLLKPGSHVDLVGSFTPTMREADDDVIRRSSVFVDSLDGAPVESGDLVAPIASGVIRPEGIRGDLFGLCQNRVEGRSGPEQITLFKSVGLSLEDLAAAELAWNALQLRSTARATAVAE